MGKKRNGFRQKIRDSLPESLVMSLKKHKYLTIFIDEYYYNLSYYIDREKIMKRDINSFNNEKTRLASIINTSIQNIGISSILKEL